MTAGPWSLAGRVAVITGGAGGIGKAAAAVLHTAGAAVVLLDVADARSVAEGLDPTGATAWARVTDVTVAGDCAGAVDEVLARHGRIDILFNNAGIIRRKTVVELDEAEWDAVLAVNLKATYLMSRAVIPAMRRQGGGVIINTGSGWGLTGGPRAAAYCAAKAGVINLTRAMAIDHGPDNIRVNAVCPGDTDTPMLRSEAEQLGAAWEQFRQTAAARPLARLGQPKDAADAVWFLASDAAGWITGTTLVVDGGGLAGG